MIRNTILLVEDNLADVELVNISLKEMELDINVVNVRDGSELIQYLKHNSLNEIALILLDLNMPRMTGTDVLLMLQSHQVLKNIPVIVFSTSANRTDVLRSYELGAKAYVCKPLDLNDFNETIRAIVEFWTKVNVLPSS